MQTDPIIHEVVDAATEPIIQEVAEATTEMDMTIMSDAEIQAGAPANDLKDASSQATGSQVNKIQGTGSDPQNQESEKKRRRKQKESGRLKKKK